MGLIVHTMYEESVRYFAYNQPQELLSKNKKERTKKYNNKNRTFIMKKEAEKKTLLRHTYLASDLPSFFFPLVVFII